MNSLTISEGPSPRHSLQRQSPDNVYVQARLGGDLPSSIADRNPVVRCITHSWTHVSTAHIKADPTAHVFQACLPNLPPSHVNHPITGEIHNKIHPR
jgi:hypothetical protein